MATKEAFISAVDVEQLASVVRNRLEKVLVIDSRSFLEFNTCHVASALNVCCSKIVKRRLQQDKVSVKEFLQSTCNVIADESFNIIVYDQGSVDFGSLSADCFLYVLLHKLSHVFSTVNLLQGGFLEFKAKFPTLCEDKTRKHVPLSSLSQPCMPISNNGPTRILPFLYLGSQQDAADKNLLSDHNIVYVINVSTACPKPDFIPDEHFLRIAVNDNYSEKLQPYFPKAFNFVDKVRESSGCVLIHCLAGISRSPTVAIAYVMRHMHMTSDDAYRYVKAKRPTISPNFNFLGQLLEYERQLRNEKILEGNPESSGLVSNASHGNKRQCRNDMRLKLELELKQTLAERESEVVVEHTSTQLPSPGAVSPTTAFAKLSFTSLDETSNCASKCLLAKKKVCQLPELSEEAEFQVFQCARSKSASNIQKYAATIEEREKLLHRNHRDRRLSFDTNFLDSSALWCKSKLFHDVKGIPLSSLRNICFTSCQTSAPRCSGGIGEVGASHRESSPVRDRGGLAVPWRKKSSQSKLEGDFRVKQFSFVSTNRVTVVENL